MEEFRAAVQRAGELVRDGKGSEPISGPDDNQGTLLTMRTAAEVYPSWMSPRRRANMVLQAPLLPERTPVLVVVGAGEGPRDTSEARNFRPAAKHPYSRCVTVEGDHRGMVMNAAIAVAAWARDLPR